MHYNAEIHLFIGLAKVQGLDVGFRARAHEVDPQFNVTALPRQHYKLKF